jgi:hypothetical protein
MASHYAEPVACAVNSATELRTAPLVDSPVIREMAGGDAFEMLEASLGWAWGYAGEERRVGYVRSDALSARD